MVLRCSHKREMEHRLSSLGLEDEVFSLCKKAVNQVDKREVLLFQKFVARRILEGT